MSFYVYAIIFLALTSAVFGTILKIVAKQLVWPFYAVTSALMLLCAWAIRPYDDAVGLVGESIIVSSYFPGVLLLTAVTAVSMFENFASIISGTNPVRETFVAIRVIGVLLAGFASNAITLVVGVVIVIITSAIINIKESKDISVAAVSSLLGVFGIFVIYLAFPDGTAGLYFPYNRAPINEFLFVLGLLVLVCGSRSEYALFLVLSHIPNIGAQNVLGAISIGGLLLSATCSFIAVISAKRSGGGFINYTFFYPAVLALMSAAVYASTPTIVALGGMGVILGFKFLSQATTDYASKSVALFVRGVGAMVLVSFPLTPTFSAIASTFANLNKGYAGEAFQVLFGLAYFVAALLVNVCVWSIISERFVTDNTLTDTERRAFGSAQFFATILATFICFLPGVFMSLIAQTDLLTTIDKLEFLQYILLLSPIVIGLPIGLSLHKMFGYTS